MKKVLALLLTAVLLVTAILPVSAASFSDIEGHWAETYIEHWAGKGVIDGYPDGTFLPDQEITRAEVAKVLAMAYRMSTDVEATEFSDVPETAWFYSYVQACAFRNIVNGYPDSSLFCPDNAITRNEAVKMVCLSAGMTERSSGIEEQSFLDEADVPAWALGYWNALYHAGVIHGYEDGTLRPNQNITRAELVKILCVAFEVQIYKLSFSIEDNLGNKVSDEVSYLTGESCVVETLIPMLIANRSNFAAVFPSGDMRDILDEGIDIARAGYADGWTEEEMALWSQYLTDHFTTAEGDASAIATVSDVTTTINLMEMDVPYVMSSYYDTEEGREDICYTVTLIASVMD